MLIALWILIGIVAIGLTAMVSYDRNPRPLELENGSADAVMPPTRSRSKAELKAHQAQVKIRRRAVDPKIDPTGELLRTVAIQLPCGAIGPKGREPIAAKPIKAERRVAAMRLELA